MRVILDDIGSPEIEEVGLELYFALAASLHKKQDILAWALVEWFASTDEMGNDNDENMRRFYKELKSRLPVLMRQINSDLFGSKES